MFLIFFGVTCPFWLPLLFLFFFCHQVVYLIHLVFIWTRESNSRPRTMAQTVSPWCSPLDHGASPMYIYSLFSVLGSVRWVEPIQSNTWSGSRRWALLALQITSGFNFTNILRAAFSYKSFARSFFVLTFKVWTFFDARIFAQMRS